MCFTITDLVIILNTIFRFIAGLSKDKVGKIVNFGSAALLNSTFKKVKAEADKGGIPMDEKEFHCKGEFKGVHKGKPDESDLKAATEFARKADVLSLCLLSPNKYRAVNTDCRFPTVAHFPKPA